MTTKSDHRRREWKLKAVKAFHTREKLAFSDIRKVIGKQGFDELLNESFSICPDDPEEGAELAQAKLYERHGERLLEVLTPSRNTTK